MFVHKYTETIECLKLAEVLVLRMQNFQGTIFKWIRAYREIFKFALLYL